MDSRPGEGATFRVCLPSAPHGVQDALYLRPSDADEIGPTVPKTVTPVGHGMVHSELRSEGE